MLRCPLRRLEKPKRYTRRPSEWNLRVTSCPREVEKLSSACFDAQGVRQIVALVPLQREIDP